MHHTIAWFENVAQDAEADIAPVTDGQWAISNGHFFPSINYLMLCAAFISEDSVRARIRTPSFRQITTPWLRPITGTLAPGSRPGIADYRRNPLVLRALEEIEFLAEQTAIGAADIYGVACVAKTPPIEMPSGDIFTLRGTSVGVAVADTGTKIPVPGQDTLPNGPSAFVGLVTQPKTAIASRLILEEQWERPGGVSINTLEDVESPIFIKGGLGIWGRFSSNRMPNLQVLAPAADAAHECYMDIIRVG